MSAVATPHLLLRTDQTMTLAQEAEVRAALKELSAPLENGQTIKLAGITFEVVRP